MITTFKFIFSKGNNNNLYYVIMQMKIKVPGTPHTHKIKGLSSTATL